MKTSTQLKTGGDPRMLPDYAALRDELAKLSHPARPDVDWSRIEQLSLALFRQNGVELQTAAWYTLARTRLAGMSGLNEGLAVLAALITGQWGAMWPQPVHARMEILSGFSQRLHSALRTLNLSYADLPQVYQAEQHLNALRDVLMRLELKNASQIDDLCSFMHNAAARLEKLERAGDAVPVPVSETGISPLKRVPAQDPPEPAAALPIAGLAHAEPTPAAAYQPLVYVVHNQQKTVPTQGAESECGAQPLPLEKPNASTPGRPWKSFIGGMLTMLLLGIAAVWGWSATHPAAVPLPVAANESSLKTLEQLPPYWLQSYGFALAASAGPRDAARLREQWQRHISGNALPVEDLSGWHQGMAGLADLTHRLNALDERKGKYLTGSELKSMVFAITHNFERAVPAEERLYQLTQIEKGALPALQASQTELHLNQLINRYMLIRGQADSHQAR